MSYRWKKQDREGVLERLRQKDYEAIATSEQGALDELLHLSIELGVFEALEMIKVDRSREGIPDQLLLRTLYTLPFIEAMGLSAAAGMLFEDAAILLRLGYTLVNLQAGFNGRKRRPGAREKSEQSKPCHPEVLRAEMERIDRERLAAYQKACVGQLFARGLVKGKTYAIDGSGIGERYRVVGLLNVHAERPLWVAWQVLEGSDSEKGREAHVAKSLIDQVIEVAGEGQIEWVLMDALYADGPLLAWLKYGRQIKALVRLPEDRRAYEDLALLVKAQLVESHTHMDTCYLAGHKHQRQITLWGAGGLRDWESFREAAAGYEGEQPSLWGCLIHPVDVTEGKEQEDWALISTEPFAKPWGAYTLWRNRWRVENNGFRELKEGWHLEKAPWSYKHPATVLARVAFTLIAFNVAQIAKSSRGRQLIGYGIRRLHQELGAQYGPAPVIVFAGDAYGIFHIEEIMAALGYPPTWRLQPLTHLPPQPPSSVQGGLS
jgi:hypothetical protein